MDKSKKKQHSCPIQTKNKLEASDRRHLDRRLCQKKGFTYIPMVGWMCRRENTRRKDDNICGW